MQASTKVLTMGARWDSVGGTLGQDMGRAGSEAKDNSPAIPGAWGALLPSCSPPHPTGPGPRASMSSIPWCPIGQTIYMLFKNTPVLT